MRYDIDGTHADVGDLVYKSYTPQRAGKVLRTIEGQMRTGLNGRTWREPDRVEVKWLNGTTSIESVLGLHDFRSLIADHEKKLDTHRRTLSRLESL